MEIDPSTRSRARSDGDGDANQGVDDKPRDPDAQPHITFAHEQLLDGTALADAMPKAAAQVEDIMLSACSTGYEGREDKTALSSWKEHFPNLKTAWGYSSPDDIHSPTESHAVAHIAAWKAATAGRTTTFDGPSAVRAAYHALSLGPAFADHNVAIWDAATNHTKDGH